MKYLREKVSDPRNADEKSFGPMKYPRETISDAKKTPRRKNLVSTKYP